MVVKLLAFWTRSEPLTPLRSVRGSAYCCLRRLRLILSFLDTLSGVVTLRQLKGILFFTQSDRCFSVTIQPNGATIDDDQFEAQ